LIRIRPKNTQSGYNFEVLRMGVKGYVVKKG